MRVYLDHNATTAVRPAAIDLVAATLALTGNASSVHADGQAAARVVDTARRGIGRALCARPEDIVFTGSGTEALNLALSGAIGAGGVTRIFRSALEHEAVAAPAEASGVPVEILPVTAEGVADLAWLERRLVDWDVTVDGRPLLALMLASNELGTIQPVAEAARLIRAAGGLTLVDAIQAAGKVAVDFAASGADYMAISAHKFGGPQGVGALIAACDAPMARQLHGGGQEKMRRAGTLNVAGIAGMGRALELAVAGLDDFAGLATWRDEIADGIRAVAPQARVLGEGAPRLPNTLCLAVPGWTGATQVMALDLAGVSISAGSACSSGSAKGSKAGTALGLPAELGEGVIRISLGWNSTHKDVEAGLAAWRAAFARIAPTLQVTA